MMSPLFAVLFGDANLNPWVLLGGGIICVGLLAVTVLLRRAGSLPDPQIREKRLEFRRAQGLDFQTGDVAATARHICESWPKLRVRMFKRGGTPESDRVSLFEQLQFEGQRLSNFLTGADIDAALLVDSDGKPFVCIAGSVDRDYDVFPVFVQGYPFEDLRPTTTFYPENIPDQEQVDRDKKVLAAINERLRRVLQMATA